MQARVGGGGGTKKIINKNKVNQKKFMFPGNQQNLMLKNSLKRDATA